MNIGMLWFDNDSKTAYEDRIRKAAAYYRQKYGQAPNAAQVNPGWTESKVKVDEIEVHPSTSVLPNHCWIGVEVQHG